MVLSERFIRFNFLDFENIFENFFKIKQIDQTSNYNIKEGKTE